MAKSPFPFSRPSSSMSPPYLLTIPHELLIGIATFLDLRDLMRIASVNRTIRALLCDAFECWSDVRLTLEMSAEGKERFSDDMMESFIKMLTPYARSGIRHLDISESGPQITKQTVTLILTNCPNLRTLSIKSCASLTPDTIAHTLALIILLYPNSPLYLPHFAHLYLRNELRLEDRILQVDSNSIATIERCLRAFSVPSATGPVQKFTDLYSCDICHNYYAGPTTPCMRCGSCMYPNLCFVCQSFCDGCLAQFCSGCARYECQAVVCQCTLKDADIMCYCHACRSKHQCVGCNELWCPKHIVEQCEGCGARGWCQQCVVERAGPALCAQCIGSRTIQRVEREMKWWRRLFRSERDNKEASQKNLYGDGWL